MSEASSKRKSKAQLKKPPEGTVVWTEATFDKLVAGEPEPMRATMRVDNAMLVNVAAREEDAFPVMRRLLMDNHEDRRDQLQLARRALADPQPDAQRRARPGSTCPTNSAAATRSPSSCRRTSRSTSRCRCSRSPRWTCSTRRRRRTPSTSSLSSRPSSNRRGRSSTPSSTPPAARRSRR